MSVKPIPSAVKPTARSATMLFKPFKTACRHLSRWLRLAAAGASLGAAMLVGGAALPGMALAGQQFSPFSGQGNVSVFDAVAGTGGWVGSLDGLTHPLTGDPFAMVSVVLFTVDAGQQTVSGQFELTGAFDLNSTLNGLLAGTVSDQDILTLGGQFALDYLIQGGTGVFDGASGFGLSFVDLNPLAAGDNYQEAGLFVATVPAPGSLALLLLALALLAWRQARRGQRADRIQGRAA